MSVGNSVEWLSMLCSIQVAISGQRYSAVKSLFLFFDQTMQLLMDQGAKLNVRDINGDTPLLICSASGFSEGVKLLLQVNDLALNFFVIFFLAVSSVVSRSCLKC